MENASLLFLIAIVLRTGVVPFIHHEKEAGDQDSWGSKNLGWMSRL